MLALMRGRLNLNFSKTYIKMMTFISIAMLVLVLSLIQFLYTKFEEIGLEHSHELNRNLNSQLTYNFDYMNEFSKNMAITLFFDPSTIQIMQNNVDTEDNFNTIRNVAELQNLIANNALLHSVVVYNNKRKEFYTVDSKGVTPTQANFMEMVRKGKQIPVLTPMPGLLNEDGANVPVFSYLMFDSVDQAGVMDSAIILNVKMDWLAGNLKKFITNDGSNFVLIDANEKVLLDARNEYRLFDQIQGQLAHVNANQSTIVTTSAGKQVITKLAVSDTDHWYLLCIRSYSSVFGFIDKLKGQILPITCIAFVAAILASLAISKLIYRPFGLLVKKVRNIMGEHGSPNYDDTEYLSRTLQSSINKYREISQTSRESIRENVLKGLLTESHFLQSGLHKEQLNDLRAWFQQGRSFRLIFFMIDQNKHYQSLVQAEKQLVKFSILNVANEIAGEFGLYEKAFLGSGEFVYLVEVSEPEGQDQDALLQRIKLIQSVVAKITKVMTISAVIGPSFDRFDDLSHVYQTTRTLLNYRLSQGSSCILSYDSFMEKQTDGAHPIDAEAKISDAIKRGKMDEATAVFQALTDDLRNSDNNRLLVTMVSLALSIGRTVQEINLNKMEDIQINFSHFYSEIVQAETLDEISGRFQQLFEQIAGLQRQAADTKHQVMINSVTDYIQLHYSDDDLSLKRIASEFKMSQGYLGQLFRETCGKSVGKYINDIRMEKVQYMLRATDWSVRDIAVKSGYFNEANFYKVFKKEFGVTPNEYRTSRTLELVSQDK
ncbi:helix-turn-helix transcriptional regulator [Paenibacillus thalictri]|uniref:helix-turn-helix transcriptional regulator n=1 Tax=Paenibacillus thalictri TaxID=2527873 RepID=UPI0013EF289C|nr:AraC family transcriptional regulator [Paenibacillus thalictri]